MIDWIYATRTTGMRIEADERIIGYQSYYRSAPLQRPFRAYTSSQVPSRLPWIQCQYMCMYLLHRSLVSTIMPLSASLYLLLGAVFCCLKLAAAQVIGDGTMGVTGALLTVWVPSLYTLVLSAQGIDEICKVSIHLFFVQWAGKPSTADRQTCPAPPSLSP